MSAGAPFLLPLAGEGGPTQSGRMRDRAVGFRSERALMIVRRPPKQLVRARAMRREPTKAEEILWRSLRSAAMGLKFRRQVPIGPYIADFACLPARIVLELDGPPHEALEQRARDHRRDAWFKLHGWRVLRIPNEVVFGDGDAVLDRIKAILHPDPSSDLALRGHLLPQAGEGEAGQDR